MCQIHTTFFSGSCFRTAAVRCRGVFYSCNSTIWLGGLNLRSTIMVLLSSFVWHPWHSALLNCEMVFYISWPKTLNRHILKLLDTAFISQYDEYSSLNQTRCFTVVVVIKHPGLCSCVAIILPFIGHWLVNCFGKSSHCIDFRVCKDTHYWSYQNRVTISRLTFIHLTCLHYFTQCARLHSGQSCISIITVTIVFYRYVLFRHYSKVFTWHLFLEIIH